MKSQINKFIELLDKSGLPEERKEYWLSRFSSNEFSEAEFNAFIVEMENHIQNVQYGYEVLKDESEKDEMAVAKVKAEKLPDLEEYLVQQPEILKKEADYYKKALSNAKDEMMGSLKVSRSEKNNQDIEAIRKKLASGK